MIRFNLISFNKANKNNNKMISITLQLTIYSLKRRPKQLTITPPLESGFKTTMLNLISGIIIPDEE